MAVCTGGAVEIVHLLPADIEVADLAPDVIFRVAVSWLIQKNPLHLSRCKVSGLVDPDIDPQDIRGCQRKAHIRLVGVDIILFLVHGLDVIYLHRIQGDLLNPGLS